MFYTLMGEMFVSIAALFALGLIPAVASRIYPHAPSASRRAIAPVLFAVLATACFVGVGLQTLVFTVALALPFVVVNRWRNRKFKQTV